MTTLADWRVEVRVRFSAPLANEQLNDLMNSAEAADFEVIQDVEVARDRIGLVLVGYLAPAQTPPADTLPRIWSDARNWLAAQDVDGAIAGASICAGDVFESEALLPDTPELLAATDVAELLGVSRQRVHQLSERAEFPAPYARLGSGPIWTRPAIEAFDRAWTRKPGRPARAAS